MANYNGTSGNDTYLGTLADDNINGFDGNDSLFGSDGNDFINAGNGLDTIDGGNGSDTVSFEGVSGGINLNLLTGVASNNGEGQVESVINFENAHGSFFNDIIQLGNGNSYAFGRAGNDSITGGSGNDNFYGGSGNDTLDGAAGGFDNANYFEDGFDGAGPGAFGAVANLTTGTATDNWGNTDVLLNIENLSGSLLGDNFTGNASNNNLFGNSGNDTLTGLGGDDYITGGLGNDLIDGGTGNDWADFTFQPASGVQVTLVAGNATVFGGAGNDTLIGIENLNGTNFTDQLTGDINNNNLIGNDGNDTLIGGDGNDNLTGGAGNDSLDGGNGNDVVNFNTADINSGVSVTLVAGAATVFTNSGTDTLAGIENITGTNFNDSITGDTSNNGLRGEFGDDTLIGNDGNDYITGGVGNDSIVGGNGVDTSDYFFTNPTGSTAGINVNLLTGVVTGGEGNDTLSGIENINGTAYNDTITGDGFNNNLEGRGGNDTIDGGAGNDNINGYEGDDSLFGGAGNDFMHGGAGNDTIDGGVVTDLVNYTDLNTINYNAGTAGVTIDMSGITGNGSTGQGTANGNALVGSDILRNFNFVIGTAFDDTITGSAALWFEEIRPGAGNDVLDGGVISGNASNRVSYVDITGAGVVIDLIAGTAVGQAGSNAGSDSLTNFDFATGSNFQDTLLGTDRTDRGETFEGRDGNDYIDGRGGFDNLRFGSATGAVTASLVSNTSSGLGVGNDTFVNIEGLRGGNFDDVLTGNDQANNLDGQGGNDSLIGGAGRDTLVGGAGNDTLDGGLILDRINLSDLNITNFSASTSGITLDLSGITGDGSVGQGTMVGDASIGTDIIRNINIFFASNFNDSITGSGARIFEQFEGGGGNDTINGGVLSDTLNFEDGNRANYESATGAGVVANLTTLTAVAEAGGNTGSDTLANITQLRGSSFADTLIGSDRTDYVETFEGRDGNDSIDGKGGLDQIRYDFNANAVNVNLVSGTSTGAGNDVFINIEAVSGSAFDDTLTGGNAANGTTLDNGEGLFESFRGSAGNDTIDGGQGYDEASYFSSTAAIVVILNDTLDGSAQDGLGGIDVLRSIEAIRGSAFNDSITGSDTAAFESFAGYEGNDSIDGKGGIDRVDYLRSKAGVVVNLALGTASDGYGGTDTLSNIENVRGSRDFNDSITGSAGNNRLDGSGGNDTINGGAGYDTAVFTGAKAGYTVARGVGSVTVTGADGIDVLTGIEKLQFADGNIFLSGSGADFNGDGVGDMLWRNTSTGANNIWRSASTATQQATTTVADLNWKIAGIGDFNGDGASDLLWRNASTGANNIWRSASTATQQATTTVADLNWTVAGIGDFNGDGASDILWRNTSTGANNIWRSASTATQQATTTVADLNWTVAGTGDYNGDGASDILWHNTSTGANNIWQSASTATQQAATTVADVTWSLPVQTNTWTDAAPAAPIGDRDFDFNGDGKSDLVWRNTSTGANNIWQSASTATQQATTTVADLNWKMAGFADFNGDGKDDMLWRNASTGDNNIWLSASTATQVATTTVADLNWKIAGLGDFNGDGKDDMLWRNTSTGANNIWQSASTATQQATTAVADQAWQVAGIGDFNGDGKDDLLWRNFSTGANNIWLSASTATQQAATTVADQAWQVAGIADFNGDGKDDLLWRNFSTGANNIWLSASTATQQATTAMTDLNWKVAGVGDYNGDGKADLAWRNAVTGADNAWLSANTATQLTLVGVADLNWTLPGQTNTWVNSAGNYVV